ncbi:hypothetical protein ISCGN_018817 [Ixodes scapularis]
MFLHYSALMAQSPLQRDALSEHVTGYKTTGTLVSLFSQLKRTGSVRTGESKSARANHERVVKVAEMQHVMQLLHYSVMDTGEHNDEAKKKNWELGDKLAILLGDFFWALAFKEIADTQDTTVLSTFARGIESFAASSFEEIPHCVSAEWWKDFTPRQCSWFASAFECSLLVAGVECPKELAEARKCGTNLVLAMQAREIINHFLKNLGQIPQMSFEEVSLMALQFGCSTAASVSSKPCEIKDVALLYRVGLETARQAVHVTCRVLWERLHQLFMKPPTEAEWVETAEEFKRRWQFPNCLGAVHGQHVAINCNKGIWAPAL